jgi:hypothetical protein
MIAWSRLGQIDFIAIHTIRRIAAKQKSETPIKLAFILPASFVPGLATAFAVGTGVTAG